MTNKEDEEMLATLLLFSSLPMQRVIDPSMMRAPEVAATVTDGGLDHGMPLTQPGLVFRIGSQIPHFTAVVWVKNSSGTYTAPFPFLSPERATQRAVGTTFLGPVSGTGSQTWAATVPGAEAFPMATLAAVAYNLTCEAECTVTVGSKSKTHAAGDYRGAMLSAAPSADVTVTTEGAWELEMAVPQYEQCYSLVFAGGDMQMMDPIYPGAQWSVVFCEATVLESGGLQLTYRSYYPDGCPVVYDEATGQTSVSTSTAFKYTRLPKDLLCAPFAVASSGLSPGDAITAYGLKAWPRLLTEAERLFIIRRDRERMLHKGHLTEADVMHGDGGSTYSLRRDVPVKVHSPGEAPLFPIFEEVSE
jgi:hypothetical protein